ncbi:electron transport complex subunit RsxC [Thiomicrorhabdus lithotrophica]|uniref:Ion-translocating oxidoreductase complex subunit C n=1 Tax=Thiomicrorhabdus lithotrophica TaxID=2949997 RepID=A0ABY8CC53_9GAMM|nr:electron transport complex subunit RsxC [Thiomicrorhabdus lithotrophica]WEJ63580.1 electron transport complex subunit RsxC [Thiomicrorhabdus lithotrophica]
MSVLSSLIQKIAPIYPQAKRWLHRFNGGVFPQYRKELSSRQPIRKPIIPERLIMPLQQQVGQPAELLVKVGDKVKKNQLIARSSKDANKALVVPIHAPTSGIVKEIANYTLPHPSGLEDIAIIIEPDYLDEALENVLQVSGKTPDTPQQLKDILLKAGIVGMGGAGFPTYAKLPKEQAKIHTLLINGAECEPFITCDDLLMQTEADAIIQGALITAKALGSTKILCGIESNKPAAIKAMKSAAQETIIEIIEVQSVYPMGGQKQLTQELTGIEMPHKAHAVDIGLLMMNVATLAAIYKAVTLGEPLTSRLVSVTGLGLAKPFNIRALIGTPFDTLANAAEPKTELNYPLVMGGPMMGFAVQNNQVPVIKTTNCILANPPEPTEMQMPCIRCGECMDACPINLLPQQMYWHSQAHEFDKVEKLNVFDCIECGCCSYVCPSHIPLVQYYRHAKSEIKEIHAEEKAVALAKERHEFKLARIEREKQEREARLKAKKDAVKKQATQTSTDKPSSTPNTSNAAAAARAAAKAAAAKKAEDKKSAIKQDYAFAEPVNSENNIPAARRKAIEAAKQAASQASDSEGNVMTPKEAAKKAAMAAAKKRAQAKKSESSEVDDSSVETSSEATSATKDPKQAAKAAAMAAAKKRAQAKKAEIALKQIEQSVDLTETTEPSAASKKEAARKAAMRAAREAAKKRKAESDSNTEKPVNNEDNKTDVDSTKNKKQQAMQLAKANAAKKAAERAAKKSAEQATSDSTEESN